MAWFAWHMKARKRFENGAYKEALNFWVLAKLINPKEFKLLFNISVMLRMLRKDKEAQEYFNLALQNIIPGQEEDLKPIIKDWREGRMRILT